LVSALPQPRTQEEEEDSARAEAPAAPAPEPPADRAPKRRRVAPVLYGLVLALVVVLFAWQLLRAGALAEQVVALEHELAAAEEDIRIHEQRMGVVRSHVDDLSARIGALRTLVTDEVPSRRTPAAD
jgi:cell division protein FtsB